MKIMSFAMFDMNGAMDILIRCLCYISTKISEVQRLYESRLYIHVLSNVSHLLNQNVVAHMKKGTRWTWIAATHLENESPIK